MCERHEIAYPSRYNLTPVGYKANEPSYCNKEGTCASLVGNLSHYVPRVEKFRGIIDVIAEKTAETGHKNIEAAFRDWLFDAESCEHKRTHAVDNNPEEFLKFVNAVMDQNEREENRELDAIAKDLQIQEANKEINNIKASIDVLHGNAKWLEAIVKEGDKRNIDDEVFARLIETFRIQKRKERDAASAQRQQDISDFFQKK